jgi:hypothetical protein
MDASYHSLEEEHQELITLELYFQYDKFRFLSDQIQK